MKKMLVLLMALVMMMTCCVCMGEEGTEAQEREMIELTEYIGRDFEEVRRELGDVPILGGDMLEAMNDQLRITCYYFHEAKVSSFIIRAKSDYTICGVSMDMTVEEAGAALEAQGFSLTTDWPYCVSYTAVGDNEVSLHRNDAGELCQIEYTTAW